MSENNEMYDEYLDQRLGFGQPQMGKLTRTTIRYYEKNYLIHLPDDKDVSVLDVGCGIGEFLNFLKICGYKKVEGIDIGKQQVEYCQKLGLRVKKADVSDFLAGCKERYDVIVMNDVLEHIPKNRIIEVLKLVLTALNPKGVLIVRTGNMANPFMATSSRYMDFTHEICFTQESLLQVIKITGFAEVQIFAEHFSEAGIKSVAAKRISNVLSKIWHLIYFMYGRRTTTIFSKNIIGVGRK